MCHSERNWLVSGGMGFATLAYGFDTRFIRDPWLDHALLYCVYCDLCCGSINHVFSQAMLDLAVAIVENKGQVPEDQLAS